MLGSGSRKLKNHHFSVQNYVNFEVDETIMIEYKHATSAFEAVEPSKVNYQFIVGSKNPLLVNTPTCLYLWLPDSYCADQFKGKQQLALVITEVNCTS